MRHPPNRTTQDPLKPTNRIGSHTNPKRRYLLWLVDRAQKQRRSGYWTRRQHRWFCQLQTRRKKLWQIVEFRQGERIIWQEGKNKELNSNQRKRYQPTLWKLQQGKCNLCRQHLRPCQYDLDHIIPKTASRDPNINRIFNIQLLCKNCHGVKTNWSVKDEELVVIQNIDQHFRDRVAKQGWLCVSEALEIQQRTYRYFLNNQSIL